MAMRKKGAGQVVSRRLSGRIGRLHEDFRNLSRSATVKDLGKKFIDVVAEVLRFPVISLWHNTGEPSRWELLAGHGVHQRELLIPFSSGKEREPFTVIRNPGETVIRHQLFDDSILGLVLSNPGRSVGISDADLLSCRLFLQLYNSAYQEMAFRRKEKALVFSLNHRILQLNSLIETGIEVARLDERLSPYQLALVRAVSLTNASRGIVRILSGKKIREEYIFPEGSSIDPEKYSANRIDTSFDFMKQRYQFELYNKESRSGVQPFDETDQLLLDALARQVEASLENRYLHRQELEKQSIERDLTVAKSIQQKILPVALPGIPGYDLAGINIPSKSIGGDYYDCIPLRDGKFAFVIADVAGKGIGAALLVSSLHSYLTAYLEHYTGLPDLAGQLNRALYRDSTDDKFITAFIAVLTPETGELECMNCGHNPAYLLRKDKSIVDFSAGGLPLAMMNLGLPYQSSRNRMERGERLFLYTDGVTEATNSKNEMFESRHAASGYLLRHTPDKAQKFVDGLITDIRKFVGSSPQADDITVMYICRN